MISVTPATDPVLLGGNRMIALPVGVSTSISLCGGEQNSSASPVMIGNKQ